tara:strand:+ start:656 stop:904 length:249 start_codon:yes stop_codon:yes gene_type:complete
MNQFETVVDDITCVCEVNYYYPGTNYPITALSEEPNDEPEFEFTLRDHEGNKLTSLHSELTDQDHSRLFDEFLDHAEEYSLH